MDKIEREHAIEKTRQQINLDIESGFLEASRDWLRAWYKYDLRNEPKEKPYPTIVLEDLNALYEAARKNAEVFRLVKFVAAKRIMHGAMVPAPMSELLGDYLIEKFDPIGPGSGRPKMWGRDIIIIRAMRDLLQSYDLKATSRKTLSTDQKWINKRQEPASELVRLALIGSQLKESMELSRLDKIWECQSKRHEYDEFLQLQITAEFDDMPETVRI